MRARTQVYLFGAAYLLYDLARWVTVGDAATATEHARSLLSVEQGLGLAVAAAGYAVARLPRRLPALLPLALSGEPA